MRSTLVGSASRADHPSAAFGAISKSDNSIREVESGATGSLNRVQLSAKYAF